MRVLAPQDDDVFARSEPFADESGDSIHQEPICLVESDGVIGATRRWREGHVPILPSINGRDTSDRKAQKLNNWRNT